MRFPTLTALQTEFLSWRFYHDFGTDAASSLREPLIRVRTTARATTGVTWPLPEPLSRLIAWASADPQISIRSQMEALASHIERRTGCPSIRLEKVGGVMRVKRAASGIGVK